MNKVQTEDESILEVLPGLLKTIKFSQKTSMSKAHKRRMKVIWELAGPKE